MGYYRRIGGGREGVDGEKEGRKGRSRVRKEGGKGERKRGRKKKRMEGRKVERKEGGKEGS